MHFKTFGSSLKPWSGFDGTGTVMDRQNSGWNRFYGLFQELIRKTTGRTPAFRYRCIIVIVYWRCFSYIIKYCRLKNVLGFKKINLRHKPEIQMNEYKIKEVLEYDIRTPHSRLLQVQTHGLKPLFQSSCTKSVLQKHTYNPAGSKLLQYRLVTVLTIDHIVTFNNAREEVYSYQIIVTRN